jgi:hypothetical protein
VRDIFQHGYSIQNEEPRSPALKLVFVQGSIKAKPNKGGLNGL